MAPATSTCTCWKTLFEKSGANGAKSRIIVAGRVRILRSPLLAEIGDERVPYPFLSRMAAQQTASAHGSINALRLFAGWCARATRKKSLTFTQRVPPRAHKEALSHSGRTPKGYPQGDGARSLRVAHFRALATFFLAKITEQGTGASRARLCLGGWATSVPYPCAHKWLNKGGRPRASDRAVINAIWYVLWTGWKWKALHHDWFGVSSRAWSMNASRGGGGWASSRS